MMVPSERCDSVGNQLWSCLHCAEAQTTTALSVLTSASLLFPRNPDFLFMRPYMIVDRSEGTPWDTVNQYVHPLCSGMCASMDISLETKPFD